MDLLILIVFAVMSLIGIGILVWMILVIRSVDDTAETAEAFVLEEDGTPNLILLQRNKTDAYFDILKQFFMTPKNAQYPGAIGERVKLMVFSPTLLDVYCENQMATDTRCVNTYASNISVNDSSGQASECVLFETVVGASKENATLRVLNAFYVLTKRCFSLEVLRFEASGDGWRCWLPGSGASRFVLQRPLMMSFAKQGLFKIVFEDRPDNAFTHFDSRAPQHSIYLEPLTSVDRASNIAPVLPVASQVEPIHIEPQQNVTLYYLNYDKAVNAEDVFYNNLALTFDKAYLLKKTNQFVIESKIDLDIAMPAEQTFYLCKNMSFTFNVAAQNVEDVFKIEVAVNTMNAVSRVFKAPAGFGAVIKRIGPEGLLDTKHKFHIAVTYTMDLIIVAYMYRDVTQSGSDQFFMCQHKVVSGNPVYMQLKQSDLDDKQLTNIVPPFSIPNYALMAQRLGYSL